MTIKSLPVILFVFAVVGLFFYRRHIPIPNIPRLDMIPAERMRILLTLVLTGAALFVVLSKLYGPQDQHWAYATLGTILGFWLRGSK
jgi:hypothetical protein